MEGGVIAPCVTTIFFCQHSPDIQAASHLTVLSGDTMRCLKKLTAFQMDFTTIADLPPSYAKDFLPILSFINQQITNIYYSCYWALHVSMKSEY